MLQIIKDFLRRRSLKRYSSTIPTGMISLSHIHTAVSFIDVGDSSFEICKEAILAFYKTNNIKGDIFFFDLRKIGKNEQITTDITATVFKKDLNLFGRPSKEKVNIMLGNKPDIFISLIKRNDFPIEFMAKASQARFKIGRVQLPGNTFDIVISDPDGKKYSEAEAFNAIKTYLKKIG